MYQHFAGRLPDTTWTRRQIARIRENVRPLVGTHVEPFSEELFRQFYRTGSRVEYEAVYFQTRRRLCAFTALSLWEEDERWLAELEKALRALLAEPTWALPAHVPEDADETARRETLDLFACETAQAVAEILSLLEKRLNPALVRALDEALFARAVRPYEAQKRRWGASNWSAVCAGSLLMAYIYRFSERLSGVQDALVDSLFEFLSSYPVDGCCLEGPLYWEYGFGYFVSAADLLRDFSGGAVDLLKGAKVRAIAGFGRDMFLDECRVLPLADAPHTLHVHVGLMHRLAREYGLGGFSSRESCLFGRDVRFRFAPFLRDFYWYAPELDAQDAKKPPLSVYPQAGWVLRRQNGWTCVCKAGHNGEPHNHNDLGELVLFEGGTFVLDDPGWPEYTGLYFGENRYKYFVCASSAGHSVPIVNGQFQTAGDEHGASLLRADEREVVMDLSQAYDVPGLSLRRSVRFGEDGLRLTDRFSGAASLVERFVTRVCPAFDSGEVQVGKWRIRCGQAARLSVQSACYRPRFLDFSDNATDDLPIETLCQIDFELVRPAGEVTFQIVRTG